MGHANSQPNGQPPLMGGGLFTLPSVVRPGVLHTLGTGPAQRMRLHQRPRPPGLLPRCERWQRGAMWFYPRQRFASALPSRKRRWRRPVWFYPGQRRPSRLPRQPAKSAACNRLIEWPMRVYSRRRPTSALPGHHRGRARPMRLYPQPGFASPVPRRDRWRCGPMWLHQRPRHASGLPGQSAALNAMHPCSHGNTTLYDQITNCHF